MPNRRRKHGAGEDPPPPASVVAGDDEVKMLNFPITTILASLAAGPGRHRALPFLELNKDVLAAAAEEDEEGESEVVSSLTAPVDLCLPQPPKRQRLLVDDAAASAPHPHPHQRRLWVKDRSSEWWEVWSSPEYPDAEFRRDFRMGRATFAMVCDAHGAAVAKEDTALRTAIPVPQRVAVCVWRLATGEPLRLVSKRFGIGI